MHDRCVRNNWVIIKVILGIFMLAAAPYRPDAASPLSPSLSHLLVITVICK